MSWVDDGQPFVKPGSSPAEFFIEGKAGGGTPVNAMFSAAVTPEAPYFEVRCENVDAGGNPFIGVTTPSCFKKGYQVKALLYGRNLSSGAALVHGNYGPALVTGSTVGVLTEFVKEGADHKVAVTFWHDGTCLGPAFLAKLEDPSAGVFPMVSTMKDGDRFSIQFAAGPGAAADTPVDPRVGTWTVQRLSVGPELGTYPLQERMGGREVVLEVKQGSAPGDFEFSWVVVNRNRMQVTSAADDALGPFDKLTPGRIASTMMMGEPEEMDVEQQLAQGLQHLQKWILSDGAMLLTGPEVEVELTPAGPAHAGGPAQGGLPATSVTL